jgi:4-carboxymuconolactone decarboxylase
LILLGKFASGGFKVKALATLILWMMAVAFLAGFGTPGVVAQESSDAGTSAQNLPPDIHLESLSRMPRPKEADFATDAERQAFDRVADLTPTLKDPKGALGPTGTRARNPELAETYRNLYKTLREKCGLEPKYFELTALVATRESNNEHEWLDHEAMGIKLLSPAVVDIVRNKKDYKGLEEKEALIIQFGREVFHHPRVSSRTFAEMERNFGVNGTLGISLVMGYYTANALLMHAYDQRVDLTKKRPFPDLVASDVQ